MDGQLDESVMSSSILLIACAPHLHEDPATLAWAERLMTWRLTQSTGEMIMTSDMTQVDDRVCAIAILHERRLVHFTREGRIREYDSAGKAVARKPERWFGRSLDRAMLHALLRAKKAGWSIEALLLDRIVGGDDRDGDLTQLERGVAAIGATGNRLVFDAAQPNLGIGGA